MLPEIEIDCIIARRGQRTGIDFQRQLPMRGEAFVCRSDANVGVDRYAVTARLRVRRDEYIGPDRGGDVSVEIPVGRVVENFGKGNPVGVRQIFFDI